MVRVADTTNDRGVMQMNALRAKWHRVICVIVLEV